MRIDLLSSTDTRAPSTAAALSLWRVGSILQATAVRDATSGQLWLKIGERSLPMRIASGDSEGPAEGEQLKLRVLRDSPVLAFEVLETTGGAAMLGDALRRTLPKQTTPMPLLANLAWHMRNAASDTLPAPVTETLRRLWESLPQAASLQTAPGLADALQKSGAFLEASFAQSQTSAQRAETAQRDFKALLLDFKKQLSAHVTGQSTSHAQSGPLPMLRGPLTALGGTPATLTLMDNAATQMQELAQQTDGTLARTVTTQVLNAEAAAKHIPVWLVEVPVRQDDRPELLRFRFEREASAEQSMSMRWAVEVALDLGAAGQVHARVSLSEQRCTVQLRSESPLLVDALNRDAHQLTAALQAEGLAVDRVICLHGAPVRDGGAPSLRLLDFHA